MQLHLRRQRGQPDDGHDGAHQLQDGGDRGPGDWGSGPGLSNLSPMIQSGVYNQRMCFYIPSAFQENPPRPSDQDVQVVMIGYEEVVVQTFGGYVVNNSKWIEHAQEFRFDNIIINEKGF